MDRSLRRGLAAVAVVAGIFATVPGAAQAGTQCGVVVCADAVVVVGWDCNTTDNVQPGFDYVECIGSARPDGRGYSNVSVPGSLTWSGTTSVTYIYTNYPAQTYAGPITLPTECTWAGLGEDSCGAVGETMYAYAGGWLPHGQCIDTWNGIDTEISATSTATASKSAPLGLAQLDSATATETVSVKVSSLPATERCAFA